uniref:Uncharacterized protein n=1 Tax=Romanomermis culicivorax TaxID=13658 RepID=A0A915KAS8_ROMCU
MAQMEIAKEQQADVNVIQWHYEKARKEEQSEKDEGKEEDAPMSPQDEREQSKGSKARVLEKVQKENQKTHKSVIPKEQDNVQWLYPTKEGEFDKPGTS